MGLFGVGHVDVRSWKKKHEIFENVQGKLEEKRKGEEKRLNKCSIGVNEMENESHHWMNLPI